MIKMKKYLAFAFTFALYCSYVNAEDIVITAQSAVDSAVKTNISIKQEAIELNSSKRNYAHSWNNFLPSVSAGLTQTNSGTINGDNTSTGTATGNISASLTLSTGLPGKIAALKAQYESSKSDYEDILRDVETSVKKEFYALLYSQENVELYKSSLTSYQNQYEQTKVKRDRGVVPELDLLSAQVSLETAKLNLQTAEKSYYNSLLEFLNTIGLDVSPDNKYVLQGTLDDADKIVNTETPVPDQKKIDELIQKCPSVRNISDSLRIAKLTKYNTIASSYLPSFSVSASINPYIGGDSTMSDNTWNTTLGVTIPLDGIIPGSSLWDSVVSNNDTITNLELQLNDKVKSMKTKVVEKIHDIEISNDTLNARKLNVELAKKTYEMTEEAYKSGTKDLLTLQTSLDSYRTAELQWRSEQYNLICYVLELENLLGLESGTIF